MKISSLDHIMASVGEPIAKPPPQPPPLHRVESDCYKTIADDLKYYLKRRNIKLILTIGLGDWQRDVFINYLRQSMSRLKVYASDDYFMNDGEYMFCKDSLKEAHIQCWNNVTQSLLSGYTVLVANTNSRKEHIHHYAQLKECVVVQFKPIDLPTACGWEPGMNWMCVDPCFYNVIQNPVMSLHLADRSTFNREELRDLLRCGPSISFESCLLSLNGSYVAPATLEQTNAKGVPDFVFQQVFIELQNLKIDQDTFPTLDALFTVNVNRAIVE